MFVKVNKVSLFYLSFYSIKQIVPTKQIIYLLREIIENYVNLW